MRSGITVAIPTIPPRTSLLQRAVASVLAQTLPAEGLSIAVDNQRQGAAINRQRALDGVNTEWTAFLDDDDEFDTEHLRLLRDHAEETQSDFVYSWFRTSPLGGDPFPPWFREAQWDKDLPRHTTITVMVKTDLAKEVGFVPAEEGAVHGNEDWRFILECNRLGKISHLCSVDTWTWHHDSLNTSGLPSRW